MKWLILACLLLPAFEAIAPGAAATQPVAPAVAAAPDVLVLPFAALGDQNTPAWVGHAVQQNLVSDLARGKFHPTTIDKACTDADVARVSGAAAGAKYVIFGSYQTADELLRFNGQLIETATGAVVGGLSQTGSSRDLFALEDALSEQAVHALRRATAPPEPPKPAAANPAPIAAAAQPPHSKPYEGSQLQAYLNSNHTPSNEYGYQYTTSYNRQTYWATPFGFGSFWPYYYGYYGYGYGYYNPYPFGSYYNYSYSGNYGYGYDTPFVYTQSRSMAPTYFSTDHVSR